MNMGEMFPRELNSAKNQNIPIVIPVGTIEYHGSHCSFGCDTLVVTGLLERLIARGKKMIVYPPIWYGVASYAVGGPNQNSIHIDVDVFEDYIYSLLKSMMLGGFKNIYLVIHHQYEQESLMPMTLACMKAAKKLQMEFIEKQQGYGWWGKNNNADYYEKMSTNDNPLNYVKVIPSMSASVQKSTGFDHAGKYEASLQMALYPHTVDLDRIPDSDEWFVQNAKEANVTLGEKMIKLTLDYLEKAII